MIKKVSIKAVIYGSLIDLVGSLVLGIAIGVIGIIVYSGEEYNLVGFYEYYNTSLMWLIPSLILGLLLVVLGGFVAGKIAKQNEEFNACLVGVVGILVGFVLSGNTPTWYNIASNLLIIPSAYLGGWIAARKNAMNLHDKLK